NLELLLIQQALLKFPSTNLHDDYFLQQATELRYFIQFIKYRSGI
ncbi:hypothetical protein HMPREF3213_03804, partial [Heyndrickxia coagulans]